MFEEDNIEDVEQSETTEADLGEMMSDLHKEVEEMEELPTEEEAELGQLCKSPEPTMVEERCRICDSLLSPEEIEKETCSLCITEGEI